jgi:hypothetical protein
MYELRPGADVIDMAHAICSANATAWPSCLRTRTSSSWSAAAHWR